MRVDSRADKPGRDSRSRQFRNLLGGNRAEGPDHALVGILQIPEQSASPWGALIRRVLFAIGLIFAMALVVYIGRTGYTDSADGDVSFLDAVYYATVSLSTTGYGDIAPVTPGARLVNIIVITPMRIMFLVVLVGTTLSVLTERSRQTYKIQRWRTRVRDHTVVVGYGTKGRSAVEAMLGDGARPAEIVVVDTDPEALEHAAGAGLVTVHGSATREEVLRLAGVARAASVVVATNRDDTAVLVTLTARELNRTATISAAIRETENVHLLRQSGADSVVVSSATAGRLLGIATTSPKVVEMMEDLLTPQEGFAVAERPVHVAEIGRSPRDLPELVVGIVRRGELVRVGARDLRGLEAGDQVLYIHQSGA